MSDLMKPQSRSTRENWRSSSFCSQSKKDL